MDSKLPAQHRRNKYWVQDGSLGLHMQTDPQDTSEPGKARFDDSCKKAKEAREEELFHENMPSPLAVEESSYEYGTMREEEISYQLESVSSASNIHHIKYVNETRSSKTNIFKNNKGDYILKSNSKSDKCLNDSMRKHK